MAELRTVRIGDLGRIVTGKTPPSSQPGLFGELYPFLTPTDIDGFARYIEPARFLSPEGRDYQHRLMLPERAVCVVCIGATIGKVCMTSRPSFTNQQINSIIVKEDEHDPFYVYHLMTTLRDELKSNAGGAATPIINKSAFSEIEVQVPSLAVQQRIAGILSAYDELIENSQRRIKILESMARALYREWFVNFRFPGHESVPRVPSPLGEIPQGWEVKALADVCSRITDGSHFSPQSVEDGYPMASVKDMHDWGINIEGCRRITSDDYENLVRNDCKPLKNDVLIAKDGSYLKHTFVVGEEQDLVILSSIAMLRPNDAIRPNYLCFTLQHPVTKSRMKGIVSGVAIPRIVLKDFRKFQILVPPDGVQADWARLVDPMVEMCRKLVAQTENLCSTRDLLLPHLLSGSVALNNSTEAIS